jgi:transcriptional regulator with XRE-family HTH domain
MTTAIEALTLRERVAADVRAWMTKRGVTGQQLAEHMNVSTAYVSRRLKGRTAFDVDDLDSIAGYLGVPLGIQLGARPSEGPRPPAGSQGNGITGGNTAARSFRSSGERGLLRLVKATRRDHDLVSDRYGSSASTPSHSAASDTRSGEARAVNLARSA